MSASPKRRNKKKTAVMKRYLGNAKSAKYKRALAAIERRNQIQLLVRQIKKLEALASGGDKRPQTITGKGFESLTPGFKTSSY